MIGYSRPAGWQLKLDEARQPPVSGTVPWQHGRQKKKGIIMNKETNGHLYILNDNIVRIADALEEILRLVKEDQEKMEKYRKENDANN
jgi:hypothetical protein